MERKIGEIFEYNGEWYQCIIGHCNQCSFDEECSFNEAGTCKFIGNSYCAYRNDKKLACFKKLEKVGEPFIGKVHIQFQRYKIYAEPIVDSTENIGYVNEENTIVIEIKQNKEDMEDLDKIKVRDYTKVEELNVMEENKLNLKPFDIQKAREGKPVCTRDGRKARIICFDSNGGRPIVALVTECDDEEEIPYKYHCDGSYNCQSIPSDNDLMMLPEKRIGWITINKDAGLFKSKEEAERYCTKDYATVRVEFEI